MQEQKKFSNEAWSALLDRTVGEIKALASSKGAEYTQGNGDRLDNFRRNGQALGLPMETVWGVYAGKHWDAVQTYIRDIGTGVQRTRSEPISGRVDDLLVYLLLLKAMLEERDASAPGKAQVEKEPCEHQWHRLDRYSDTCVFCNAMRGRHGQ